MKRKEAIKQLQEGKIQIYNDLLPSTKEITELLKEAFPDDNYFERNECQTVIKNKYFLFSKDDKEWVSSKSDIARLSIINLSTILKKSKSNQLENQYSKVCKELYELKKDVAEIRQIIAKDVDVDVEVEQEQIELIVGEWYKHQYICNYLVLYKGNGKADGFFDGAYRNDLLFGNYRLNEGCVKADPKEVEKALIQEAKKRGYKKGVKTTTVDENITCYIDDYDLKNIIFEIDYPNSLNYGDKTIFKDGIWAEIIEQQKEEEIDWDKPQFLQYTGIDNLFIVLSTGKVDNFFNNFEGIVVYTQNQIRPIGFKENKFSKKYFKPFKGELIIKND